MAQSNTKSTSSNKSTASKSSSSSTKKSTTKKSTTKKQQVPPLHERQPTVLLKDTGYALTGLTVESVAIARSLPERLEKLRTEGPDRIKAAQGNAKATVHNQREHYKARLREQRETLENRADETYKTVNKQFDKRVAEGRKVHEDLRKNNDRFSELETQVNKILDQAKSTRSQIKAAFTSVKKTADAALEAGKEQAGNAKTQVKAAATSARKTAETVVESTRELAS